MVETSGSQAGLHADIARDSLMKNSASAWLSVS